MSSEFSRGPLQGYAPEDIRLLVESVQDYAIFMLDSEGYIVTWNLGAMRLKGYTPDEAIGQHFSIFYTDEDRETNKPGRILQAARREGKYEDEGWRVRKDGTRFWANINLTALRGPDGAIRGFAKITRDITERRRADEALHQSEQKFRLLVESVRDYAIFMLSPEGRIISWNAGAQRIKGYTAEEILSSHFSIFYPPEDVRSGKPTMELETAIAEGRYEEEGWRVRKDGTRFWANVVLTPVRDQNGTLIGFAKVTRDLTERRRAREELFTTQQAMQKLSLANSAKEEFMGIVAHELRSPLTTLYGSAKFLHSHLNSLDEKDREDVVSNLVDGAEQLRQLVENLLALGRPIPTSQMKLVDANLQECIAAAVATFELRVPRRAVQIMLPAEAITVRVERTNLASVLRNLLDNADKYGGNDSPIEIWAESDAQTAIIEVRDRGPGVEPEDLERIFESFYRSAKTSRSASGSGLGLAVCRRLLSDMGGSIEARLRPGGGLILRARLALASSEQATGEI